MTGLRSTGTYLDRIIADKREELERLRRERPIEQLRERMRAEPAALRFEGALRGGSTELPQGGRVAVIAEVKRASPSKGKLMPDGMDPVHLASDYTLSGANAISVVTEEKHFQGSIGMLHDIRVALDGEFSHGRPPLLRKDFLFDSYHVEEARAFGADAILLIAALLDGERLYDLLAEAETLGMGVLVEAHDEDEMAKAVNAGATIIGVNNRDLRTFEEDLGTTERLAKFVPEHCLLVAESGIRTATDVARVAAAGADVILVGEALVTAGDVVAKMKELHGG